jgi:DNA polymerase (family 10)
MNNFAVARVFSRIADLMEIQGQDFFKIRAYRNAAQVMQDLTESLEVLAERGELKAIPGVGDAIADKTRDILATGTTRLYDRLREEVPESLTGLLHLSGFGPKKIQAVWKHLGVTDLDSLEAAARAQRLRDVPGLGAKSEEGVLRAIEGYRRRRREIPVYQAYPYAENLVRELRATGRFHRLEVAGSLRRMKDVVADINLAGSAEDTADALAALEGHAEVQQVLERGDGEIAVETLAERRVTLRVGPPAEFGALWLTTTGAPAHLAALGTPVGRGAPAAAPDAEADPDEAAAYALLGLPWIPPELREGLGEVEAARAGQLPRLITAADMRGILHAHSTWSDGLASLAEMAETARGLGFAYHAATDHSKALAMVRGLNEDRVALQGVEIDRLNAGYGGAFRLLKGIECDILPDGALDLDLGCLAGLEVVVASVHSALRQDRETLTGRVVRALESGVVDILGHPTSRILGMRDPSALDMDVVMTVALEQQVALEINAYPDRLDLNAELARRAAARGLLISLNTDAHKPDQIGALRFGIGQARRAGLTAEQVINTWPLERLLEWLTTRAARRG